MTVQELIDNGAEFVLALSYGKDSLRSLAAIKKLGWPLHRIVHREIWATDTIPADLPPMVEFKAVADKWILDNFGITVEHVCATERQVSAGGVRLTYEKQFYKVRRSGKIYGFPIVRGNWCTSQLKTDIRKDVLSQVGRDIQKAWRDSGISNDERSLLHKAENLKFSQSTLAQGAKKNIVQYLGIAADEPKRIERHQKRDNILLPLVEIGWTEDDCWKWCKENGLLSPIYTTAARGGCWFCHNQSVDQLRLLRKNYPEYWQLLLKWDEDSPVSFKPDGRTVHDFDRRFELEDEGYIKPGEIFRWGILENPYIQLEF